MTHEFSTINCTLTTLQPLSLFRSRARYTDFFQSQLQTKMLLLLLICFGLTDAIAFYSFRGAEWDTFKAMYNKQYSPVEETFRHKIFLENRQNIHHHNLRYRKGLTSFAMEVNQFADLLPHEFKSIMLGVVKPLRGHKNTSSTYLSPANIQIPDEIDWREKGYVTEVKNQGQCGSCWAFSTTGSLEGQHFRKTGKLVSLSEQNLVDCSTKNNGCNGGMMDYGFQYVQNNGGIDTELSYPYEAVAGECRFKNTDIGATVSGYVDLPQQDENALKEALGTVGPISVAIDAGQSSFQFYSHGVYYEPECSSEDLDHGVLAVGYGTEQEGGDYWLIKNSWGGSWGEEGYIKMARNQDNNCGVATMPSYPLV